MTDLRVCFIECAHKREAFFFSVNSLHEARLVLDAISRFDLHFRPEPSELATAGWVERRAGDGWEDLFFFSVNSLHEARLVLDAISRFDLHFRPEPSELAPAGWVERRAGDGWEDLTENELDELIAEQSE